MWGLVRAALVDKSLKRHVTITVSGPPAATELTPEPTNPALLGQGQGFARPPQLPPFGQPLLGPCNVSSAVRRRSKSVIATLLRSGASYLEPAAERISREGSATRSGSLRSGARVAAKVRSVLAAASTAAAASASWPV
jgi:hypothetical protein